VRNSRYQLVCVQKPGEDSHEPNWQLFDLKNDPGEKRNVVEQHQQVARELEAVFDRWWKEIQPSLVNENVPASKANPFKQMFWEQYGYSAQEALRRALDAPLDR
jgi:hypothetical protein